MRACRVERAIHRCGRPRGLTRRPRRHAHVVAHVGSRRGAHVHWSAHPLKGARGCLASRHGEAEALVCEAAFVLCGIKEAHVRSRVPRGARRKLCLAGGLRTVATRNTVGARSRGHIPHALVLVAEEEACAPRRVAGAFISSGGDSWQGHDWQSHDWQGHDEQGGCHALIQVTARTLKLVGRAEVYKHPYGYWYQ